MSRTLFSQHWPREFMLKWSLREIKGVLQYKKTSYVTVLEKMSNSNENTAFTPQIHFKCHSYK